MVLHHQIDLLHPLTTLEQKEVAVCTSQTLLLEDTLHTWGEDVPTESSSKLSKFDETITKDSWDSQDTLNQPFHRIEEGWNIEPREPIELRLLMVSDVWHVNVYVL